MNSKKIAYCGLFVALIIIGAFIKIPIPVVPFTLQFLFTMLAGLLLGSKLGALSVTIYMVLGLIGIQIFAEGGGIGYIFKPSFGYISGFILGSFLTGFIVENLKTRKYYKVLLARRALLTNDGEKAFKFGASATITGNMLTTVTKATIASDKKMLEAMGRNI